MIGWKTYLKTVIIVVILLKFYCILRVAKLRHEIYLETPSLDLTNDISTLVDGDLYHLAHLDNVKLLLHPDESVCDQEYVLLIMSSPKNRKLRDKSKIIKLK